MGKQNIADKSIVTPSASLHELRSVGVNQRRKKINFFKWVDELLFYGTITAGSVILRREKQPEKSNIWF
jgi:hypothetical protein